MFSINSVEYCYLMGTVSHYNLFNKYSFEHDNAFGSKVDDVFYHNGSEMSPQAALWFQDNKTDVFSRKIGSLQNKQITQRSTN